MAAHQAPPSLGFSRQELGVGCHCLLQCMKVKSEKWKWSHSVVSDSLWPHGLQPTRLLHPWDFPRVLEWGAIAFSPTKCWGHLFSEALWSQTYRFRESTGGPMVRTRCTHCQGPGVTCGRDCKQQERNGFPCLGKAGQFCFTCCRHERNSTSGPGQPP